MRKLARFEPFNHRELAHRDLTDACTFAAADHDTQFALVFISA